MDRDDTLAFPPPSLPSGLWRGLTRRCARCGGGHLFSRWFSIAPQCPGCGLRFEREQGYWTGAMMIDIAVTEGTFLIVFILGMVVTWPDVPWGRLLAIVIAVNVLVPLLFYPVAQTLWIALERHFRAWSDRAG